MKILKNASKMLATVVVISFFLNGCVSQSARTLEVERKIQTFGTLHNHKAVVDCKLETGVNPTQWGGFLRGTYELGTKAYQFGKSTVRTGSRDVVLTNGHPLKNTGFKCSEIEIVMKPKSARFLGAKRLWQDAVTKGCFVDGYSKKIVRYVSREQRPRMILKQTILAPAFILAKGPFSNQRSSKKPVTLVAIATIRAVPCKGIVNKRGSKLDQEDDDMQDLF